MEIEYLKNKTVKIENYQSTFIILNFEGKKLRFDFFKKTEFQLNKGTIGKIEYFENHPLLINYNENYVETFINSKPKNTDLFIDRKSVV